MGSLNYCGQAYFYIRNVQGEIIKLISETGTVVVEYTYDAWGNPMDITGSMASTLGQDNPFRYKGYYYDTETGLYYLNARYYNPEWGRFINADSFGGKSGNLLTHNLFAYCANNPVNAVDPSGHCFMLLFGAIGAVVGGVVGGVIAASTGGDFWTGAAIGAVAGGVIGLTCGAAASYVATGTIVASTTEVLGAAAVGASSPLIADALNKIYSSWQQAEQALRNFMGSVQSYADRTLNTPFGRRIVDALNTAERLIGESKYGYQGLSESLKGQIAKDIYLIGQGYTVEWHFFWSQVSNTGGYSRQLWEALYNAGIKIIEHY